MLRIILTRPGSTEFDEQKRITGTERENDINIDYHTGTGIHDAVWYIYLE